MNNTRIFVTGLGVVSPLGSDMQAFWDSLCSETHPPTNADSTLIAEGHMDNRKFHRVPEGWDVAHSVATGEDFQEIVGYGNATRFGLHAAAAALRDAGLDSIPTGSVVGVSVGTAAGDTDLDERARSEQSGNQLWQPAFPFCTAPAIATRFGLTGPNHMVSTACSAGGYSISMACDIIRSGEADVMVVGGAEGASRVTQGCFNRLLALDPEACRPFDSARKGTVMGEGAAMLILESESHARARKRQVYAEIKGWGWSCDGYNPTAPDPTGEQAESALWKSLADSGLSPLDIDCLLPHGTGTALNDRIESEVVARVFGKRIGGIPVSPIKSKLGHGAGASAAFSCLVAALILRTGLIPPAGNLEALETGCELYLPRGKALREDVLNILISSYAFGGNNISLVMGRSALLRL